MLHKLRPFPAVLLLFALAGCPAIVAGGAAGAGGYAWYKGEMVRTHDKSVKRCYTASIKALKKLGMPVNNKSKDALGAVIESKLSDGKQVRISIKRIADKSTEIAIRVGPVGDREKSDYIMKTIEKLL